MKKVLIIVDTSRASGRKFLAGAERYISALANWEVYIKPPNYLSGKNIRFDFGFPLKKLDGLLIRDAVNTLNILNINIPKVINDTHREFITDISTIITNSKIIGENAADFFLSRGFKNFAFCGFQGFTWSQKRLNSYKRTLNNKGVVTVHEFINEHPKQHQNIVERWKMAEWLKKLPRPVCVFACNDDRAVSILEACKIASLNVPEEVAVLGVDNDELMCNLSSPSLSSIELDFENAGFVAAQHLDEQIQKKAEYKIINVDPLEIIQRRSTDVFAVDDKDVVRAMIYIKQNYQKPIQAVNVVDATCLSRRELEKRFKKHLKRTIKSFHSSLS